MSEYLLKFKLWLNQLGVEENQTEIHNTKARIFTYMVCFPLLIQFLLFIRELITMDTTGITIISSFIVFSILLLVLHSYKGLNIAARVYNIMYATIMGTYLLLVGKGDGIEYSFFIFMASAVIFPQKFSVKFLQFTYCILLFVSANYYLETHTPLLDRPGEQSDEIAVFIAAAICFFSIIYIFNSALERYYNQSIALVDSLKNQNETLTQLNNELERFAFIASHDLKTPLLNIINFSELLKKKINVSSDKEVQHYLTFISEGGNRMKNLIEDLLEYTEFTQKEQKLDALKETIDLEDIVIEIKSSISVRLAARNAKIELIGKLPKIEWTKFKLFILFKNIIENGIKYNQSAQPIVRIKSELNTSYCSIYFEDNGIGIPKKYQDQIFGLFKRLHNQAEYEGTGLGLATCKKIVEEMGGKIAIESVVGEKTVFIVQLPLSILVVEHPELQQAKELTNSLS